jgi:MYXO-CTERM domain-containing protein
VGEARAFCRTTTCPLPPDFAPSPAGCYPADFAQYCASLSPPSKALPIWWRNACVSYDIAGSGTRQVAYATVANVVAAAFAKWTGTTCSSSVQGTSRVSIDVRDLGPVDCDQVQYNSDQGNSHVIAFRDDVWPHNDANNTLGLTTVTFDPDSGEIYDADMEINATVPLSTADLVPAGAYDFESIVTHETGHFLGLAHSGDDRATMFAHYTPGSSTMRVLADDDVSGICAVYPPGGVRSVDPSVPGASQGGLVPEGPCDPTPRHGFSRECKGAPTKACSVSPGPASGAPGAALGAAGVGVLFLAMRRSARACRDSSPL